jgi:uncharacterized protein YndB with AHSA1/START domain
MTTDRIEKKILLRAPLKRVWQALADSTEFGSWFGMKFTGPFVPGARMLGTLVPTTVDQKVAEGQKKYEGVKFEFTIERMEPERLFSFRWHPGASDPKVDYSVEPTTLVVFELAEQAGGVLVTLTESGFDQIPLARRAKAFKDNDGGWTEMMVIIEKYVHGAQ